MLRRPRGGRQRLRLDRAFCRLLGAWALDSVELVGTEAIPGVQHEGQAVLPSDHFGLLLRLRPAEMREGGAARRAAAAAATAAGPAALPGS
jgi:hypothetical protein